MTEPNYPHEEYIRLYFNRVLNNRTSNFSTDKCRNFVQSQKKNFNNEQFLRALAGFLAKLDEQLSDYSDESSDDSSSSA